MSNEFNNSLLWSFTKDATTSFLFGTMHVKDYRIHQFIEPLQPYIKNCTAFATEFNLDEFRQSGGPDLRVLPENQSLADLISIKKYNKAKKQIKKSFNIDLDALAHFLPLFITNIISEATLVNSETVSMDTKLWQMASLAERQMFGLESVADQYTILSGIPLDYQIKSLLSITKNVTNFRKKIAKLIVNYEKQNLNVLYQSSKKSLGKQKQLLLYDRNENMTKVISHINKEVGSLFAAVGAAHLAGKYGILRKLKHSGYKLSPVKLVTI